MDEREIQKKQIQKREATRYFKIGLTVFLTFVACILFFFLIFRYDGFASSWGDMMVTAQPIIIGLILAFLLNPVMKFFEPKIYKLLSSKMKSEKKCKKMARGIAVTISILLLIIILGLLIAAIVPAVIASVLRLVDVIPGNIDNVTDWVQETFKKNQTVSDMLTNSITKVSEYLENWVKNTILPEAKSYIAQITSGVITFVKSILNFLIGIIVAIYVMTIQETFIGQAKKIIYTIFKPVRGNVIIETVRKSNEIFSGFISGKILDSAIIGVIAYIGCGIMRIPDAMLVAVIIGVTNIIPFFGPIIGAVPTLLLVVIQSPIHALYLLIFIIILQQVDGNIIGPKILGESTGLSSFWVLFAILVFGGIFGFVGMLLGVPVFAVIYYIIRRIVNHVLAKRGLPTLTEDYVEMSSVDLETNKLVYDSEQGKKSKRVKKVVESLEKEVVHAKNQEDKGHED